MKCLAGVVLVVVLFGCLNLPEAAVEESEAWAVTAWGEEFEIFAETGGLVVGRTVKSHTHVTILEDFSPMREGKVSIVLAAGGREEVFTGEAPIRDGIYSIAVTPVSEGEFELSYRIVSPQGTEEIPGGRVQVTGLEGDGGGVVELTNSARRARLVAGAEAPISFLKEQQWRTEFSTAWVAESSLSEAVRAPGKIRPVAGGEILLTAPVDGIVGREDWPFAGLDVDRERHVFEISPRIGVSKSLAELAASTAALEAELEVARQRHSRLGGLLELGAVSQAEVDLAHSHEVVLVARADASRRDLETARANRQGDGAASEQVSIRAPFTGRVAEVLVTPGQTVEAGMPMARLVKAEPVWLEVSLTPRDAGRLSSQPVGLVVSGPGTGGADSGEMRFEGNRMRLVSIAPTINPRTGTVKALFQLDASVDELRLGSVADVEILLDGERLGVVVPVTALVDDSGVSIVYAQLDGESFARFEVDVLARRSGKALIEGLPLGSRLVAVGGSAVRRSTLVATEAGEGHIH
jgi:cobalt-zinc-cadmium efflux system membrane fusion protein